jgi:hypothetical protein
MRRRAVSHNLKRLPKRLQSVHRSQVEKSGGPVKKPKRPSRKYRRSKSNLLEGYNRRQRKFKSLETHIWHSKRWINYNDNMQLLTKITLKFVSSLVLNCTAYNSIETELNWT